MAAFALAGLSSIGNAVGAAASSLNRKALSATFVTLLLLSAAVVYYIYPSLPAADADGQVAPVDLLKDADGQKMARMEISPIADESPILVEPVPDLPETHKTPEHQGDGSEQNGHEIVGSPLKEGEGSSHISSDHTSPGMTLPIPSQQKTTKISGLFEDTPFGAVPIKSKDGDAQYKTVFDAYKIPFVPDATAKGVIAIIMVDYGLSASLDHDAVIKLPRNVSFTISPYASDFQAKINQARSAGHEIWLQQPVQSAAYGQIDDSGPLSLLSGLNTEQNNIRLLQTLARGYGYAGLAFTYAPFFEESKEELKDILAVMAARGLPLVEAVTDDRVTSRLAESVSLPYTAATSWIDAGQGEEATLRQLQGLESAATQHYFAVAFIRPQPNLFSILKKWEQDLPSKNLQLAPLSTIIEKQ